MKSPGLHKVKRCEGSTMHKNIPDKAEAERFLKALDPQATFFTFQTFDDDSDRKDHKLACILHGTLDEHWDALARLNAKGAGVFVTINETDGKGRKAENIVRVRCLFVDLDGAPIPDSGPLPHIIVETSPGHWHVYWRVYWPVVSQGLIEFADKQRALIALHGGDPVVCDLPRVMRLPGFFHLKREPSLVRILTVNSHPADSADGFDTAQAAPRRSNIQLTADEGRIARAIAFIPNDDDDWKEWCDLGLAIYGATGGSDTGFAIFDAWSQRSDKYNARHTYKTWIGFEHSPPNCIGAGTILHKADEANPDWADLLDDGDPDAVAVAAAFVASVRRP